MARPRKKTYRSARLNPFTGRREPQRVTQRSRAERKARPTFGAYIKGTRKRRTTPTAPLPFSYGWERVYRKR